jgi:PAS domain S-box-containing protein
MNSVSRIRLGEEDKSLEILWQDSERILCRISRDEVGADRYAVTPNLSADEHTISEITERLKHEYELKDYLESDWAARPLELLRERGQTMLVVDFRGEQRLDRLIGHPLEIERFLRLAVELSVALGRLHGRGLVHKDIKPTNILVDASTSRIRLTGFGIASRLPRERQAPGAPEFIAGTLPYMAPEQTGRMNRSIDSRSDLYSMGVTLYQMLTGSLPFEASDPAEWVHSHIAKRPIPPAARLKDIPESVSSIVMKLLSKTLEERYQTAFGVESDLRKCLSNWTTSRRIEVFTLGEYDVPDRLMIPEKLYGREAEIGMLCDAFARIAAGGAAELVLVSGYSGIGKSSIVNELHKVLVPPRGLFASGKFDQYKRDIPYATLAQAFQSLIQPLLSKSEEELGRWRHALCEALEPNGQLIVELVPELMHIIGKQPPVPELPPGDAQSRFKQVFRRFINVFARPEHPLVLFLDDLQWLDTATLDLLEGLLTKADLHHLLLIGAYRDNEVGLTHPLARRLEVIRQAGVVKREIILAPLVPEDLGQLLSESLHCDQKRALPLAELVHEKTTGNPFFAIQFISTLTDEKLVAFDYDRGRWAWDLNRIHAKGYTDNVVELMVAKLNRLPVETQKALQQFACLGNSADFDTLRMVYQDSKDEMHGQLWEAVRAGLIFRSETSYRFLHDRVQEAAYFLIPQEQRAQMHLRIGRLLAESTQPERLEDAIFDIVNQLNRGSDLISSIKDRERVAELNLVAGRRARLSTAFASALTFLGAARALLAETAWELNYNLVFSIEYLTAECELMTGNHAAAEKALEMLAERAQTSHDRASVIRMRLNLYTAMDQNNRGVEVFLEFLRRNGTDWQPHPTHEDAMREYERIFSLLGNRQIEDLIDLPLMTDPDVLDMLDVFAEIAAPVFFYDENLSSMVICRMVSLSLEHGNCDASSSGYVWFATCAGPRFNKYKDGFRFGQLGYNLVEKRGLTRYQARTHIVFGNMVVPWAKPAAQARDLIRRGFDLAYRMGDYTFAAYSWDALTTNYLTGGDPLAETQSVAEKGVAFAKSAGFGFVVDACAAMLLLVRSLRGLTPVFGHLSDYEYYEYEADAERRLVGNPALTVCEFFYLTRKLQARFFAGDFASALGAERRLHHLIWSSPSQLQTADFRFFGALTHAALWNAASPDERQGHFGALLEHQRQMDIWAEHSPWNFESCSALIAAEVARIEGKVVDAEQFYEKAIHSAHANGLMQNEAIANEMATGFYSARGFTKIARVYFKDARDCYLRWGADGKVRQLDSLYPHLGEEKMATDRSVGTMGASVEHLDLSTVIKVSQAVSGEIELERLVDILMRTALEHAGAERGLLILPQGNRLQIDAEATTLQTTISVRLRGLNNIVADLPETIVQYVVRTRESVILDDASSQNSFSHDAYMRRNHVRSVLCLPLVKQAKLIGVLYLENNLTQGVFTPARVSILKMLASEAAISLENTRLYSELKEREARIRRLVEANIIGIVIWTPDGRVVDANEAFLQLIGYSRDDLVSGRVRWTDLTPDEWRERDEQALSEIRATGTFQPFEKEYLRKDGSRVPVLIGGAIFEEKGTEGVAFIVDLSEQKHAESAMHRAQADLAHVSRITTLGELTASIAHEVNQPLGSVVNNANACLSLLSTGTEQVEDLREALTEIIEGADRASAVISRVRQLSKKAPYERTVVSLKDVISEVLALADNEAVRRQVTVRTDLADGLPSVVGDRVQLQQVLLNLVVNGMDAMNDVEPSKRILTISGRREFQEGKPEALVCVQDSGTGFKPEDGDRLFEAFYSTKPQGMGMGLAISRSIIEAHGGRLWAESNPDAGAALRFNLPSAPQTES